MNQRFTQALAIFTRHRQAQLTALEAERALLDLGFYNIEFSPPAAAFDGVRYPLHHRTTELS